MGYYNEGYRNDDRGGFANGFAFVLVLFILLVIIGAAAVGYND